MPENTIDGLLATFASGLTDNIWAAAAIGLPIAAAVFGIPFAIRFVKKVASK